MSQLRVVVQQLQDIYRAFDPSDKDGKKIGKAIENLSSISAPGPATQGIDQQALRNTMQQQKQMSPILQALTRQAAAMPQVPGGPASPQPEGGAGTPAM